MILLECDYEGCDETVEGAPESLRSIGDEMVGCPLPEGWQVKRVGSDMVLLCPEHTGHDG